MLFDHNVRSDLSKADLVSVKIDAYNPYLWKKINRPYKTLFHDAILDGIGLFKEIFKGKLVTETMLVGGINDGYAHIYDLSLFLGQINPETVYLAIPTRPPSVKRVTPPNEKKISTCYYILKTNINHVEYLTGYEGNNFGYTGNVENDILNTASIHPLREDAIIEMLRKAKMDWETVEKLINQKKLVETEYNSKNYYVTK